MSYKENDYGSYESPNSIILGMLAEEDVLTVSNGVNWGDGTGTPGGDDGYDDGDDF